MAKRAVHQRKPKEQVGIRELRQNLSVYVARVKKGERIEVTEHGRPVALLVPLPAGTSALQQMVDAGLATAPTRPWGSHGPPLPSSPGTPTVVEMLDELRADRF
ncbi:MAG: type II toxin-antitoxin system Phd/YefM family antitoxin [Terriglobales bacterium]